MKRVCIGIHVYAEPDGLRATLNSLRANTTGEVELLLLSDGPDKETASALATISRMSPDYGLSNGVGSIDRTSSRVRLLHCAVPPGTVEMVGFT